MWQCIDLAQEGEAVATVQYESINVERVIIPMPDFNNH